MTARIVVAGTSSGAGKTSVACGLIAALRGAGHTVQAFKVGPDYIDPSYHRMASGRPGRNLDAFLAGPERIAPLARHGSAGADVAVIEGVMGLFDGASGRGELASTGHVAKLLRAPVLLVIDAAAMSRSAAAIVHGFRTFDPEIAVAGVVLNKIGSDHHEELLREAIEPLGVPVLGALHRDGALEVPERHLGLVPAGERSGGASAAIATLAESIRREVDVEAVMALARAAPALDATPWEPPLGTQRARIALARSAAFGFHYEENLELLAAAGAELAEFDPTTAEALPDGCDALVLAGGFPEVFADRLAANERLRAEVAAFAQSGRPVVAECGGLLFLCESLDDTPMCGIVPARARMAGRLSIGYREAVASADSACWRAGEQIRGHEFHYSAVEPVDGSAWTLRVRGTERPEGYSAGSVHASYLHVHWAAFPQAAQRLVAAAAAVPAGAR